jgi:hypothetical protein
VHYGLAGRNSLRSVEACTLLDMTKSQGLFTDTLSYTQKNVKSNYRTGWDECLERMQQGRHTTSTEGRARSDCGLHLSCPRAREVRTKCEQQNTKLTKWFLFKYSVSERTGFSWLRTGSSGTSVNMVMSLHVP